MEIDIEAVKTFLTTDEGKAYVEGSEVTSGLKTKKDELLSKNVVLNDKLKAYSELGDIDTLRALVEQSSKTNDKDDAVDANKFNAQIEHLNSELMKERGIREAREKTMVNSFVSAEVATTIAKHKGVPELLNHVVANRLEAKLDENGKIIVTVMNSAGEPMFKNGKEATIEDLILEIKANSVYGRAFDADTTQGSNARPTQKTGSKTFDLNDPNFNLSEAMKRVKRH